jgi:hypothetical protein
MLGLKAELQGVDLTHAPSPGPAPTRTSHGQPTSIPRAGPMPRTPQPGSRLPACVARPESAAALSLVRPAASSAARRPWPWARTRWGTQPPAPARDGRRSRRPARVRVAAGDGRVRPACTPRSIAVHPRAHPGPGRCHRRVWSPAQLPGPRRRVVRCSAPWRFRRAWPRTPRVRTPPTPQSQARSAHDDSWAFDSSDRPYLNERPHERAIPLPW